MCPSGNGKTIGIEIRSEIAWGLERGLTAKGHEDILGGDGSLLCLNCGYSYQTVYLCQTHQTVSVKGVSFTVDKLYLNRLDFKKYISRSKPTIFQMGKQAPDEGHDLLRL